MTRPTALFDVFGTLLETDSTLSPYRTLVRSLPEFDAQKEMRLRIRRVVTLCPLPTMTDAARRLEQMLHDAGGPADWRVPADDIAQAESEIRTHLAAYDFIAGAAELLRDLRAAGWQVGLVSNIASPYIARLNELALPQMVDAAAYSCDAGIRKPDPRLFFLALSRLPDAPPSPDEVVMIGDQDGSDMDGANATGLRGIRVHGSSGATLNDVRLQLLG